MAEGLPGGTSFMEDYTYHLEPGNELVLGAHMLEVCPTLSSTPARVEIHPLGIGAREDPVRLVFTADPGEAVVLGMNDLGDRFRFVLNQIDLVEPDEPMPALPVGHAVWRPRPDMTTALESWLRSGGPHHTTLSTAVEAEMVNDLTEILRSIRNGKYLSEFMIATCHCHQGPVLAQQWLFEDQIPDFLPQLARATIDNGADMFVGHGPHVLRGIEIYKGKPIFYGLGEFYYQWQHFDAELMSGSWPQEERPAGRGASDLFDRARAGGLAAEHAIGRRDVLNLGIGHRLIGELHRPDRVDRLRAERGEI
jgi:hypothetical protein